MRKLDDVFADVPGERDRFADSYYPTIRAACRKALGYYHAYHWFDIDDLAQDAWREIVDGNFRVLKKWDHRSKLRTYIYSIAYNVACEQIANSSDDPTEYYDTYDYIMLMHHPEDCEEEEIDPWSISPLTIYGCDSDDDDDYQAIPDPDGYSFW
jgi:RNA polymerase sigma factor (sigma-70 family)